MNERMNKQQQVEQEEEEEEYKLFELSKMVILFLSLSRHRSYC